MRILLLSYGVIEYDGRLRELIQVCKGLGDTTYVTRALSDNCRKDNCQHLIKSSEHLAFCKFLIRALAISLRDKRFDVLFIDNRMALIPALLILFIKKPRFIIQDARELYLLNEVDHIYGKIGCVLEKFFFRKADVLICANEYRARIMKKVFSLPKRPLVFENIRRLEFENPVSPDNLFENLFPPENEDKIRVISTAGCSLSRLTDSLVLSLKQLGDEYELFVVGCTEGIDRKTIENLLENHNINNVHLLGTINQNDLKLLIKKCHVGVVNYNSNNTNNRFCASGKIYEFIFEGLPVVTTENPPLVHLVNKNRIGVADNSFCGGIKKIAENYSYFKKRVEDFSSTIDVVNNNQKLREQLLKVIENERFIQALLNNVEK